MKNQHVVIRIPEPCHEDWNKMTPDAKGKFCASCATSVVDFSKMTDDELKHFLITNAGKKTCGHFKNSQINKKIDLNITNRSFHLSYTYRFVIVLFIVFGSILFSCTDQMGNKVKELNFIQDDERSYVMGDMVMYTPPEVLTDSLEEVIPPPPIMIGYEEGEMVGAIAFDYDYIEREDTLTGDVVVVEEPNFDPVDSCSFDGIEKVGFSPPLIQNDTTEEKLFLGGTYLINEPKEDSLTNEESFKQNLNLVTNWKIFPNPSNGKSTVQYYLQKPATVRLDIFDITGKHVTTLVNQIDQHTGIYHIPVSTLDLSNGVYIVSLIVNGESSTEKLIVEH